MYILRAASHSSNIDFFSHLDEKGLNNSATILYKSLKNLQIDTIYVSPFVRSIETIYLYAKKKGIKIMVDYSLYDWIDPEGHGPGVIVYNLNDVRDISYLDKKSGKIVSTDSFRDIINEGYSSSHKVSSLRSFESSESLMERAR